MGEEVLEFARAIGATDLKSGFDGTRFHGVFKRRNYFLFNKNTFLIVKISRNKKKVFWGLGKDFVEIFNLFTEKQGNYFFVGLVSNQSGWIISKRELAEMIADGSLSYSDGQSEYKVNSHNLKDYNGFESIEGFLRKMGDDSIVQFEGAEKWYC